MKKGFGFVQVDGIEKDIFISKKYRKNAMNNDIVQIKILATKHGQSKEGKIVKILNRDIKQVVGTFQKSRNFGFVIADDKKFQKIFLYQNLDGGKQKIIKKLLWKLLNTQRNGKKRQKVKNC